VVAIVQKDTDTKSVLREIAKEIPASEIGSAKLNKIVSDMKAAIRTQDDAVAIAAPQIGKSIRLFVISKRVFEHLKKDGQGDLVFINPEIIKLSRKKTPADEGCLSVRPLYGMVERAEKATVRALDEHGKEFTYGASGLLAQIFQHEIDHLNGILFTDKATETWEFVPEKKSEHEPKAA
jgi:peptide deformylase